MLLLSACATGTAGRNFNLSDVDKIAKGDSKEKVMDLLGAPYATGKEKNAEAWNYSYSSVLGAKIIIITFVNDKVTQITRHCTGNKKC